MSDVDEWLTRTKESARLAEQEGDTEEASGLFRMIARQYAKMGKVIESQIHANKAAVYDDEEENPMRFINE